MKLIVVARAAVVLVIVALVHASPVNAQIVGLSQATPGARAVAMGGTFVAIADDASAAVANPGGLVALTRPQVYLEFSSGETRDLISDEARANGLTVTGVNLRGNSIGFLSVSVPINDRITVAATRYQFYGIHQQADIAGGFHFDADATGVDYSGSVAARITPQLRVGVTVGADRTTFDSEATRSGQAIPGASDHSEFNGVTAVIGALFQATDMVGVGAAITRGSEDGQPNRFRGGFSVRPASQFLASVDVVHLFSGIDSTEVHAGGEYSFPVGVNRVFVRAGGFAGTTGNELACDVCENNHGATFGAGFTFGQRLQADLAFVTLRQRLVASVAARF
jgi:hypothetical protein